MAEKIVSPGVFTKEIDASFLPAAIGDIGAVVVGPTTTAPISPIAAGKNEASISFVKTPGETIFSAI